MMLPIHPFPARMAPELALEPVAALRPGSTVLDPMAGSGTVLRVASDSGHRAIGFDLDPLAVLMAKVWTTPVDPARLRQAASSLVERARDLRETRLGWIDDDPETGAFVDYWFAEPQQSDLRHLSAALLPEEGPIGDALRIGLSRIIITKDHGASLARDVSHSRPHRVWVENDFPVFPQFLRSVDRLAARLTDQPPRGNTLVAVGDARNLATLADRSIDAVITSPPYLNAIDYLRGHRLSLVWLGHRLAELRRVRASYVGAERGPDAGADLCLARELSAALSPLGGLSAAERRMVERYALDLRGMLSEIARVVRRDGTAVFVVGNSCVRGVFIKNAQLLAAIAEQLGFTLRAEVERALPPNRRYLPPPGEREPSDLEKRLRSETVLTFWAPR